MTTSTVTPVRRRPIAKTALWTIMGLMALYIFLLDEIPVLSPGSRFYPHFFSIRWLLIPHATAGVTAMVLGPLQFSSRFRSRHLRLHRIMGRVYVAAILIATLFAIIIATHNHQPPIFYAGTLVQSGSWMVTTLAAFLTARNRHIQKHREWMIRSYAVTFSFILVRLPDPLHIPIWDNISPSAFGTVVLVTVFLCLLIPDLAFSWRELTQPRLTSARPS